MFNQIIAPVLALTATLGLFAVPQQAMAQTASQAIAVTYADLDLATSKGQQTLERRITRAARKVCGMDDVTSGTRMVPRETSACYAQALRQVRTSVASALGRSQVGG